jgi:hypothetical protein
MKSAISAVSSKQCFQPRIMQIKQTFPIAIDPRRAHHLSMKPFSMSGTALAAGVLQFPEKLPVAGTIAITRKTPLKSSSVAVKNASQCRIGA